MARIHEYFRFQWILKNPRKELEKEILGRLRTLKGPKDMKHLRHGSMAAVRPQRLKDAFIASWQKKRHAWCCSRSVAAGPSPLQKKLWSSVLRLLSPLVFLCVAVFDIHCIAYLESVPAVQTNLAS